jgi:hypothetical protein
LLFDLDLDGDNLTGEDTKRGKLRALIAYYERRDSVELLLTAIKARRADVLNDEPNDAPLSSQPADFGGRPRGDPLRRRLRLAWTRGGEDWLDFVSVSASLSGLLRLSHGETDWTVALILFASLVGGLRSLGLQRSAIWREDRWRLVAQLVLVGVPALLLLGLLGYHLFLRRQVLIYFIILPLAGVALRVAYLLYKQIWRPSE